MLNIKMHNLSLEEIFGYGRVGCIEDLKPVDWELLESLVNESFKDYTPNDQVSYEKDKAEQESYTRGLEDGEDSHEENLRLIKILKENGIEY